MGVNSAGRRAVFLDRDGVITRALVRDGRPYAPLREEEFEILPETPPALRRLHDAGLMLVVVTNQPEVSRGALDPDAVDRMHARLTDELPIAEVRTCIHDDSDHCSCRKPAPGLLIQAAADHGLDLDRSFMVGDRWRDVGAGRQAGCTTVFIDRRYSERQPQDPDVTVESLDEAVDWILSRVNVS